MDHANLYYPVWMATAEFSTLTLALVTYYEFEVMSPVTRKVLHVDRKYSNIAAESRQKFVGVFFRPVCQHAIPALEDIRVHTSSVPLCK